MYAVKTYVRCGINPQEKILIKYGLDHLKYYFIGDQKHQEKIWNGNENNKNNLSIRFDSKKHHINIQTNDWNFIIQNSDEKYHAETLPLQNLFVQKRNDNHNHSMHCFSKKEFFHSIGGLLKETTNRDSIDATKYKVQKPSPSSLIHVYNKSKIRNEEEEVKSKKGKLCNYSVDSKICNNPIKRKEENILLWNTKVGFLNHLISEN